MNVNIINKINDIIAGSNLRLYWLPISINNQPNENPINEYLYSTIQLIIFIIFMVIVYNVLVKRRIALAIFPFRLSFAKRNLNLNYACS